VAENENPPRNLESQPQGQAITAHDAPTPQPMKTLKQLLGLCEHDWEGIQRFEVFGWDDAEKRTENPIAIEYHQRCKKCKKMRKFRL
jgi:hypothetical protein